MFGIQWLIERSKRKAAKNKMLMSKYEAAKDYINNQPEWCPKATRFAEMVAGLIVLERGKGRKIDTLYVSADTIITLYLESKEAEINRACRLSDIGIDSGLPRSSSDLLSMFGVKIIKVYGKPDGYIDYSVDHGNKQLAL